MGTDTWDRPYRVPLDPDGDGHVGPLLPRGAQARWADTWDRPYRVPLVFSTVGANQCVRPHPFALLPVLQTQRKKDLLRRTKTQHKEPEVPVSQIDQVPVHYHAH